MLASTGPQVCGYEWMQNGETQFHWGENPMAKLQAVGTPQGRRSRPPRVLLADDQRDVLEALQLLLKRECFEIETANTPQAILQAVSSRHFDLLVLDLNYATDTTSGQEGLDLLAKIRNLDDTLPIVAMTAWGSVELAVEAMHRGVGDFVLKPWDNSNMLSIVRSQIAKGESRRMERRLMSESQTVLRDEVSEACEVQQRLMPKDLPALDGYEFSGASRPAHILGGDYYDVFHGDGNTIGLCIADVSGKGLPAALLMANLQATVQSVASEEPRPHRFARRVNLAVRRNVSLGRFVTLFYCLLDTSNHRLSYVNAGHNAPILIRQSGEILRLESGGPVLGIFDDVEYQEGTVPLEVGDRLVLFTDGLSEAVNNVGEEFGEDRIIARLKGASALPAEEIRNALFNAVDEFSGGYLQDDATIMIVAAELPPRSQV
jgi:sigma-B regulation protein RsbU (phosphoserine phosphatase)